MRITTLLEKKRQGKIWEREEVEWFVQQVVRGTISEAQIAAWLMAACIQGLNGEETAALTTAMAASGTQFQWSHDRPVIDKHSTGGVGDTVSLILLPVAVAAGCAVPMISGRGLGHTGGTVDKLESIVGMQLSFEPEQYRQLLERNGGFFGKQTANLAPADRVLYQIRDVTATVESVGLITASILSKKIAEDLDGLVLDLKVGRGAFMTTMERAQRLAEQMLSVAQQIGLPMRIVFSTMDQPLGTAVGNWVEVQEAMQCLQGRCPEDLRQLTAYLAAAMVHLAGIESSFQQAQHRIEKVWRSGEAWEVFQRIIRAQGGDLHASQQLYRNIPKCPIIAWKSGIIVTIHARKVGELGIELGVGRYQVDDPVDYAAGFVFEKKEGDPVEAGEVIGWVQGRKETTVQTVCQRLREEQAIVIEESGLTPSPVLSEIAWIPTQ